MCSYLLWEYWPIKTRGWGGGGQNTLHIQKSTLINILVKGGIDKNEPKNAFSLTFPFPVIICIDVA